MNCVDFSLDKLLGQPRSYVFSVIPSDIPSDFLTTIVSSVSLPGGWLIPIAILFIISFPPVRYIRQLVLPLFTAKFCSSSVTKSSPFYVALFGAFGWVSRLLQPAHFSENWAISSACSATFGE
jgi:hypothetical protein